jgi:hypothetical protein
MRRQHRYATVDLSTVALCMFGAAVLMVPIFGLLPLIAVAFGMALSYGALDRLTRAAA